MFTDLRRTAILDLVPAPRGVKEAVSIFSGSRVPSAVSKSK